MQKYSLDQLNSTKYDSKSIMLYGFPGNLIVGGVGTKDNTDVSATDKSFIAAMYPKAAPEAAPKLRARSAPASAESFAMAAAAPLEAAPAADVVTEVRQVRGKVLHGITKRIQSLLR